jgi:hypothetical protein
MGEPEMIKPDDFTRINNDVNGNPRYVLHFLALNTEAEKAEYLPNKYEIALIRARKVGGKKFHNKQYGGGVVFQSYSLPHTCEYLNNMMRKENMK